MKISIGFSPCPNDTYIFDALVNNKIDTEGIQFDTYLEDVETLNQWALEGRLAVTKLSYGAVPLVLDKYIVLNSGSALGKGVGPLLISKNDLSNGELVFNVDRLDIENKLIALPGEHTTAHLLFSIAYPFAKNKLFLRYDEIEDFVVEGKGLGVIIHENRFTYEQKGLTKITDLGEYWEQITGQPIPLGGIVIDRSIPIKMQHKIDSLIRKSIEFANANYPYLSDYIFKHSQEMSESVIRKHIDLYVNQYSIELGEEGKAAVLTMLNACQKNKIQEPFRLNEIFSYSNQS